jgi:hypothetical protein
MGGAALLLHDVAARKTAACARARMQMMLL